jgi:release factor glutamine methyltransferase
MPALMVEAALQAATARLQAGIEKPETVDARHEALILLAHVLGVGRSILEAKIIAHPEFALTADQITAFEALVSRRASGEPLPYLTGLRAFYRHEFLVTPDVLIPRPETEHLVDAALDWVRQCAPQGHGLILVDVGTGSGAIGLSLAAALPQSTIYALDVSPAALEVARRNAARIGAANVIFGQGDLLEALPKTVCPDLIAANLPYIPADELADLPVARHEPRLALDGGPYGLDVIRRLVGQAVDRLADPGCLLLEIGAGQGAAVAAICTAQFSGGRIDVINDYAGHDRVAQVVR